MKLYTSFFIGLMILCFPALMLSSQTEDYNLGMPRISKGHVINGINYYGPVDIECSFTGETSFTETDKDAFYSLDAGLTWLPATIKDNAVKYSIPTKNDYINQSTVAVIPGTGYVVCWTDKITQNGTSNYTIYFQIIDFEGLPVGEKVIVNSKPSSFPLTPEIAALSDNGFVIIWSIYNGPETTLLGKKYDSGGVITNDEFEIRKYNNINSAVHWSTFSEYHITAVPSKGFVVTWIKGSTDVNEWCLEGISFDMECVSLGSSILIENSPVLNYHTLGLNNGAFLVSWPVLINGNNVSLISRIYNNILYLGNPDYSTEYIIDLGEASYNRTNLNFPASVTYIRTDGVTIIEQQDEELVYSWIKKSGGNYSFLIRRYNAGTQVLGEEKLLYTTGNIKYAVLDNYNNTGLIAFYVSDHNGKIVLKTYNENDEAEYESIFYNYSADPLTFVHDMKLQNLDNKQFLLSLIRQDQQAMHQEILFLNGDKTIYVENLNPDSDLAIQCKLVDPVTDQTWFSETRHYLYANPLDGKDGSIDYENGFTGNNSIEVFIDLPEGRYQGIQLYKKEAAYLKNGSPAFGEWIEYGKQSTLSQSENVILEDGKCFMFKWVVKNNADFEYEYTSPNIVICDLSPPEINYSYELNDYTYLLKLDIQDKGIGTGSVKYRLNTDPFVDISGKDEITLILKNGSNHIELQAGDLLENYATCHIFQIVSVIEPEIFIYGIEEGSTYGDEVQFKYSGNVELMNVIAYLNHEPVRDIQILYNQSQTDSLNNIMEENSDIIIKGLDADGNQAETHMRYTKGGFILYLKDLEEGEQIFGMSARDTTGKKIETKISFILDHDGFNFTLLSPRATEYETNTVSIEYWSSMPLQKVWYTLNNGSASEELILNNLEDGNYTLAVYGQTENNMTVSKSVDFSVKQTIPWITIIQPVDEQIFSTRDIEVLFDTNAEISYSADGKSGTATSGMKLNFETDGKHVLGLKAIHPVSGNQINYNITFYIDTLAPDLELIMPQPGMYAYNDIPITFKANKALSSVQYYLDGLEIERLEDLPVGTHEFKISCKDASGRTTEKKVSFSIITLELLAPAQNEKIITEEVFPTINYKYLAEGNFQSLSQNIDNAEPRLIVDPPGVDIPVKTKPGTHNFNLRGYFNEYIVGKTNRFQIGIKNVSVHSGSIDYSYTPVDDPVHEAALTNVSLRIYNTGDVDIDETIPVRFDHVSKAGTVDTQITGISNIPVGKSVVVTLDTIEAMFGDEFLVTIDPGDEIKGEWKGDNSYGIIFQTAQITGVSSKFSGDDEYLEDVSLFNIMQVDTAGPVAYVEFHTNSKIFVDNTPENGFNSYVDLGLLTVENNYVKINAVGMNGIVLDSYYYYFNIQRLKNSMKPHRFPWAYFAAPSNSRGDADKERIVMSEIELDELLELQLATTHKSMSQGYSVVPVVTEENKVNYQITTKVTSKDQSDVKLNATNVPLTNGYYDIPKGQSYLLLSTYDPNEGYCINLGAFPIDENTDEFEEIIQSAFEQAKVNLQQLVDNVNGWLYQLENEEFILKYVLEMINENVLAPLGTELDIDVDQNDDVLFIHWKNVIGFVNDIAQLGLDDWLDNVLGVYYYGIFKFTVKEELKIDVGELNLDIDFDGKICLVCDENNQYELVGDAQLDVNFYTDVDIRTPNVELEMDGFVGISLLDIILPPLLRITGDLELYSLAIDIPMSLNASVRFLLADSILTVSPFHFAFHQSTYYSGKLFKGRASAQSAPLYAPLLTGMMPLLTLGANGDIKGKITLKGIIDADLIASIDETFYPDFDLLYYLYGYIHPVIKAKWSVDLYIFGFIQVNIANSGGWQTVLDEEISGSIGEKYSQEDVDEAVEDHTTVLPLNGLF